MLRNAQELELNSQDDLLEAVQKFSQPRYAEAYTKGVHDVDAAKLLAAVLPIHNDIGLLRYDPRDRALAILFWTSWQSPERDILAIKISAHGKHRQSSETNYSNQKGIASTYIIQLQKELETWLGSNPTAQSISSQTASTAQYLFDQLCQETRDNHQHFVVSPEAANLAKAFRHELTVKHTI